MKTLNAVLGLVGILCLIGCTSPKADFPSGKIIDLTHSFGETTIYWPTAKAFHLEKVFDGVADGGYYYTTNNFSASEHGGTHIDAPSHFSKSGTTVDAIPLTRLIGEGVVVDVSDKCAADRDYRVQVDDFLHWEKQHGRTIDDAIVLLRTGFGKHWPDKIKYLGTDERGPEAVAKLHFPGLHPDAARWLVKNRSIKALGLDTASIDYGQSTLFECHVILYGSNIPGFENLANLDQLPAAGFTVIALPMKVEGGSGGPLRIVAVVNP
ncbi:MAG: cyclase family protein [bacterium]